MKSITKMSLVLIPVMLLVLEGCGGDEAVKPEETAPTKSIVPPPAPPEPVAQPAEVEPVEVDPLEAGLLSQRIVYFDFDSSQIRGDSIDMIREHANYLASNGSRIITLEGNTDERGTREYNIALGEQRADAVRRMLLANGVADSQIQVVSYGEERPAQLGHSEDAWSANRRAVFVY
ncbi:MAG: peptidoglycan-associated lipoprotein Pal [Thiohalomonadales bacterium]